MPSVHNANTCWGNRKCYRIYGEYPEEEEEEVVAARHVSSSGYYGYQPVHQRLETRPMDLDPTPETLSYRKRPAPDNASLQVKRIRPQEMLQQVIDITPSRVMHPDCLP